MVIFTSESSEYALEWIFAAGAAHYFRESTYGLLYSMCFYKQRCTSIEQVLQLERHGFFIVDSVAPMVLLRIPDGGMKNIHYSPRPEPTTAPSSAG